MARLRRPVAHRRPDQVRALPDRHTDAQAARRRRGPERPAGARAAVLRVREHDGRIPVRDVRRRRWLSQAAARVQGRCATQRRLPRGARDHARGVLRRLEDGREEEVLLSRCVQAVVLASLLLACVPQVGSTTTPGPTATVDIKRSKIDIAYSAFVDLDVHHATSKSALLAMTKALNDEAAATKGKADLPTLDYTDTDETSLADFKKFGDAAQAWAARNPQLSADRIADVAIAAMIAISPDCHTSYINKVRQVFRSRVENITGSGPMIPGGTALFGPDQNNLQLKLMANNVAYITFSQWAINGTYNITTQL